MGLGVFMRPEKLEKVLERLAVTDKATLVVEKVAKAKFVRPVMRNAGGLGELCQ
jgi:hypothetical protein